MQLKRVGDVLAQPQQTPRQQVVLLDDAPWNVLALTPCHQRRVTQASHKGQKCKAPQTANTAAPRAQGQAVTSQTTSCINNSLWFVKEGYQKKIPLSLPKLNKLCDSNDGPWSSLDDAGDAKDAKDEAPCGHAGSNDVPDSDCMLEDAEPHELDDKLGLGGQTPSPQSIVSSQPAPSQQYIPCLVPLLLSSLAAYNLDLPDHKLHPNMLQLPCHLNVEKVSPHISPVCHKIMEYGPMMDHNCVMAKRLAWTMMLVQGISPKTVTLVLPCLHTLQALAAGRLHSEEDCSGNSLSLVSEHHAFLSLLWCKLLDEAKGRMQLYVAMEVLFLCHEMAINSVCMEILVEMVIKYEDDGLELEAGFYPEHKRSMAMILFHDTQTFHSEIEKVTVHIVPFEDLDSLGRTSNFAHSTLKKTCLTVYYCTSSKSLCQFAEFQESVPLKALTLVTAIIRSVLMTFKKHGVAKNETLCGDEVEDAYNNITHLVDQVWCDDYHRSKLNKMLWEWAKAGLLTYTVGCCTVNQFCTRLCTTDREGPSCYGVAAVTCCNRLDSGEGI
ncbi:hypothetical protein EDD17DRAFT_1516674 [Pisolithus thermaeus]|nr:hypothetical protein EV401DRAFT_1892396 [Pisolithus croceorrhizus]KAI6139246.1 hypothetical protein EDD17DRAFT_1516674 [Pisolithus thermaeus]